MTGDAESFMVAGGLRPVHPPSLASIEIAGGGLFIPSGWRRFIVRAAEDDAGGNGAEAYGKSEYLWLGVHGYLCIIAEPERMNYYCWPARKRRKRLAVKRRDW